MEAGLARLPSARRGHFLLESGHHGELWLDLELLCHAGAAAGRQADELAARLQDLGAEVVCGPLVEGAFVALRAAERLGLPFVYSQPERRPGANGLFPVSYRLPGPLRLKVRSRRVLVVNDVINAGSAVRGTLDDLRACGAEPVAIGSLVVLGTAATRLAEEQGLALVALEQVSNRIWTPAECPLCRQGLPLTKGGEDA